MAGAPGRAPLLQLGPGQCDHVERVVARPLEQVLDEVEERRVRPLHVLERQHGRVLVGEALEEEAPGGEEVLPVARLVVAEPEQLRQSGFGVAALFGVQDVLVERGTKLAQRDSCVLVLADPAAHAHHVGERPVRDALPVGETATAMPVDGVDDPVEVLVELPRKPRLADPGDARDRNEVRLALVRARVEEILDLRSSRSRPTNGASRPADLASPAPPRRPERAPERRQTLLALELERTGVVVDDRLLG